MTVLMFCSFSCSIAPAGSAVNWDTPVRAVEIRARRPGPTPGGVLFRSLLDAGLVDEVDVTVMPVLLGGGADLVRVYPISSPPRPGDPARPRSPASSRPRAIREGRPPGPARALDRGSSTRI